MALSDVLVPLLESGAPLLALPVGRRGAGAAAARARPPASRLDLVAVTLLGGRPRPPPPRRWRPLWACRRAAAELHGAWAGSLLGALIALVAAGARAPRMRARTFRSMEPPRGPPTGLRLPDPMSVLRNLETKLADLVEGGFGRMFRSEVRPGRAGAAPRQGDGRTPHRLAGAHLRAQRVRRAPLAARPRALRGDRARGLRRAVRLPARARARRAPRACQPARDRAAHRRAARPRGVRHRDADGGARPASPRPRRIPRPTAARWSSPPPSACRASSPRRAPPDPAGRSSRPRASAS